MSFLPPVPNPPAATVVDAEPPQVVLVQRAANPPATFRAPVTFPPRPTAADPYLRRADRHFASGRRLYQNGEFDRARQEFDRAVDVLLDASVEGPDSPLLEKKYEKLVESIYRIDVEALGAAETAEEPVFDKSPLEAILELTFPIDPKLKNKVRDELQATVSQLPLQQNNTVLSYINFFSSERGRRILIAGLRRSGRYREMISRILAEEGVPQELIFLAQAESGFLPRAVSNKAAVGMWQFVKARGREYGLHQTKYTDDRLDPEKATRAAARHLRDLYGQMGDWYLAIAGYNCGPGGVNRAVQRTGYADFWELHSRRAIPRETANYVPIIVAMTIMVKNSSDYGLDDIEFDPPVEYDTIMTDAPTSLALIADAADRPVTEVRELNPALLSNMAPDNYEVRVPKGTAETTAAALQLVPVSRRASWRLHRVDSGETLGSIAKRYSASSSSIAAVNREAQELIPGSVLLIPAAYRDRPSKAAAPKRGASKAAREKSGDRAAGKRATLIAANRSRR